MWLDLERSESKLRLGLRSRVFAREVYSLSTFDCAALREVLSSLSSAQPLAIIVLTDVVRPICRLIELSLAVAIPEPGESVARVFDVEVLHSYISKRLNVVQRRPGPQSSDGCVDLSTLVPRAARVVPDRPLHEMVLVRDEVVDSFLLRGELLDIVSLPVVDELAHIVCLKLNS